MAISLNAGLSVMPSPSTPSVAWQESRRAIERTKNKRGNGQHSARQIKRRRVASPGRGANREAKDTYSSPELEESENAAVDLAI